MRRVALLVSVLAGACGRDPPAPLPTTVQTSAQDLPHDAAPARTTASPAGSAGEEPVIPDSPFPPRWKLGQRWRVRIAHPGLHSFVLRPFEYTVTALPDGQRDVYVLRVRSEETGAKFVIEFFRDGSFKAAWPFAEQEGVAPLDKTMRGFEGMAFLGGPSLEVGDWPVLQYPAPPRALPASPLAEAMQPPAGTQRIEPSPDGVVIRVESSSWPNRRLTWTWRRGDPWWSTLREELRWPLPREDGGEALAGESSNILGELVR